VFDPEQDTFIVTERELSICINNGNFKLLGPAPANEIPPQATQPQPIEATPEPEPEPVSAPEPVVEENEEEEE